MGINFNDTTQPAALEVCAGEQKFKVSITAPVGELLQPHTMSERDFSGQQSESRLSRVPFCLCLPQVSHTAEKEKENISCSDPVRSARTT